MKNFDFNNADNQSNHLPNQIDVEQVRSDLLNRIEGVLFYLFPNGRIKNKQFYIGNLKGDQGKSLIIQLEGEKQGNWFDFATNQGGDIFNLWQEVMGYQRSDFPKLLTEINEWLGAEPIITKNVPTKKSPLFDELGKPTAQWNYLDQNNKLIVVVYRYDPEGGKEFRIWDVQSRKAKAPDIRPLYNIPNIINSSKVIIVEGEKAADALNQNGFIATTAMCGSNAPLEKTDWSILQNKEIIIWPDKDQTGMDYAIKLADHLKNIAGFISVLNPPENKKEKWDAYDAIKEGFNIHSFLKAGKKIDLKLPSYSILEFLNDDSQMPEDLISPRLLTPGGLLLIGGAPKVGKSDFVINFLIHMAAGRSFLGFKPPQPLKIFYLQAEIGYHYLRERIKTLKVSREIIDKAAKNLIATANVHMILDDKGIEAVIRTIKVNFLNCKPDIICIDPIRNLFDGGANNASENDNNAMLFFLQNRIERLRQLINPDMGIVLCHHTKKIKKKELEEDPFQAFSGAGSLRSFYSSGLILHRPDELDSRIHLYFELRNGSSIPRKIVEKEDNKWVELSSFSERLIKKEYGEKLDLERDRKADVILQLIEQEALKGKLYTSAQFAEAFENTTSLGAVKTITDRISVLSTKGYIKFIKNGKRYGFDCKRSRYGLMCIKNMKFKDDKGYLIDVLPTHYKSVSTGVILPVENDQVWILQDEEESHES